MQKPKILGCFLFLCCFMFLENASLIWKYPRTYSTIQTITCLLCFLLNEYWTFNLYRHLHQPPNVLLEIDLLKPPHSLINKIYNIFTKRKLRIRRKKRGAQHVSSYNGSFCTYSCFVNQLNWKLKTFKVNFSFMQWCWKKW